MLLKNASVLDERFQFVEADVLIENGLITMVGKDLGAAEEAHELGGLLLLPGLVDIHIHGCAGFDTCDATREALAGISAQLLRQGVTAFCPTTMTISPEGIQASLRNVKDCMDRPPAGAEILGVNMEGPYIAASRKGAQKADFVRRPDWEGFQRLFEGSGGIIKIVDIAPECDVEGFIEKAAKLCRVSIAHTDADYETAKSAFRRGVSHVTHLFNAMPGFNHREPGTVGAVFDDGQVMAELICDGFHIHPAALCIAFRLLGPDRVVVVSDAMRAAGLADGSYELGGQLVEVINGQARLSDGTIAGSTTNLLEEVRRLVSFGIPLAQAVRAASLNPARAVGEDARLGSIAAGKCADLIILDPALELKGVIKGGEFAFADGL